MNFSLFSSLFYFLSSKSECILLSATTASMTESVAMTSAHAAALAEEHFEYVIRVAVEAMTTPRLVQLFDICTLVISRFLLAV